MLTTSVTLMYCNDICIPRDRVLRAVSHQLHQLCLTKIPHINADHNISLYVFYNQK